MSRVVILGGGHAGITLATTLAQRRFAGSVTVVTEEPGTPTQRPPLSKSYLLGDADAASIALKPIGWFADTGIHFHNGTRAKAIDREAQVVTTDAGSVGYDQLVFATGGRNRRLGIIGEDLQGVLSLRTIADADRLAAALAGASRVAIVGAGFIGLEIAAVAAQMGKQVTVLEAGTHALARSVSSVMSAFLLARHRAEGVHIRFDAACFGIEEIGGGLRLHLAGGETHDADVVLVAVGIVPADELAAAAGLAIDNGILVDDALRTADRRVFAIGDCARFPHPDGSLLRLESVQNAADQARIVAAQLTGEDARVGYVPWFWSDQFDMKLTIAGVARPDDDSLVRAPGFGRHGVARVREGRLVALETVNLPAEHMAARRLIADRPRIDPAAFADPGIPLKAAVAETADAPPAA